MAWEVPDISRPIHGPIGCIIITATNINRTETHDSRQNMNRRITSQIRRIPGLVLLSDNHGSRLRHTRSSPPSSGTEWTENANWTRRRLDERTLDGCQTLNQNLTLHSSTQYLTWNVEEAPSRAFVGVRRRAPVQLVWMTQIDDEMSNYFVFYLKSKTYSEDLSKSTNFIIARVESVPKRLSSCVSISSCCEVRRKNRMTKAIAAMKAKPVNEPVGRNAGIVVAI